MGVSQGKEEALRKEECRERAVVCKRVLMRSLQSGFYEIEMSNSGLIL